MKPVLCVEIAAFLLSRLVTARGEALAVERGVSLRY